jgi:CubicO group peptidase (beta-lactamase class C family)
VIPNRRLFAAVFRPLLVIVLGLCGAEVAVAQLPVVEPAEVGLDAVRLARIDELVAEGIAEKRMPGCVVCIGRQGKIAWLKAYGNKQVAPSEVPMTTDTLFDMASITKPVATATSVMLLVEQGKLRLSDKVADHIPEFAASGKKRSRSSIC